MPLSFSFPRQDTSAPLRKVELEGGLVEEQLRKSWGRIELLKQQQQVHQSEEEDDDDDDEETEQTGMIHSLWIAMMLLKNTFL